MNHHITRLTNLIHQETARQEQVINLIASENYASPAVLAAAGSTLTNKYAEGYPGRRYYGGCQMVDEIESYAITLAKELFGTQHANVQPHAGSSANLAAYLACLKPGDTVLGMSLAAGGHLTHGYKLNFSGTWFNFVPYGVDPVTHLLDYDQIAALATEHKPKLLVAGASAYSRLIDYQRLAAIAKEVGALFMADIAHVAGMIAAGIIPSPVPYADLITTTTHKTLRGPRGGMILAREELGKSIDRAIIPGCQGGPLMHIIAAKAVAFAQALEPAFKIYQQETLKNADLMATELSARGYKVLTGGTDTHLFLIDLYNSPVNTHRLTGKDAQELLERCGIVINRNAVPFDTLSPFVTSGIRLGTPAITTRGFGTQEVKEIVAWIDQLVTNPHDVALQQGIANKVQELCAAFPIYGQSVRTAPVMPKQDQASVI